MSINKVADKYLRCKLKNLITFTEPLEWLNNYKIPPGETCNNLNWELKNKKNVFFVMIIKLNIVLRPIWIGHVLT